MPGFPLFWNLLHPWTHFSFLCLLWYILKTFFFFFQWLYLLFNSLIFSRLIEYSIWLPTQTVWQDGNSHLRESGSFCCCLRQQVWEDVWGSFQFYIAVISTVFLLWPWFILFGHRLHDLKFSKALKYMSMFILCRKAVRNELGSHWNDFLRISVKPFLPAPLFPPVPSKHLSFPYQFAHQTFQPILFPVTLQFILFLKPPVYIF